uniref:Ig-like domain-containing protein n=1 Tax=Gopherus agassizii TaxID=38772 RepID=A0A452HYR9_9SAUR
VYFNCLLCLLLCTATLAPDVVAQFEGDITLNCLFPSQPGMNLQRLTLTWQKEQAGAEALVLHSYYYGKEQLERQDQIYRNRTQLDPEGLARGNASLTLRGIRIQDEGIYLLRRQVAVMASTADLPLLCVPAPYSEVRLEVSVSSQVTLTCRAEGGYPEASVLWLDGARNNVTAESDTSLQRDLSGLCDVSSRILLPRTGYGNYTCILESPSLSEGFRPKINFFELFAENLKTVRFPQKLVKIAIEPKKPLLAQLCLYMGHLTLRAVGNIVPGPGKLHRGPEASWPCAELSISLSNGAGLSVRQEIAWVQCAVALQPFYAS